jgi:phosphoserine phosphatase RsbU/P
MGSRVVSGRTTRRHPLSTEAVTAIAVAIGEVVLVAGIEVIGSSTPAAAAWLAIAPLLAAAFAPWRPVVGVGVLAVVTAAVTTTVMDSEGLTMRHGLTLLGLAVCTAGAVVVSNARQRQNQRYADLAKLASVTQEAVLRPLGPQVGQLVVAGRYVSASAAADIGGDLYEALDTPFGVRMIIGDVTGKGLDAIRMANLVLGAYRQTAFERSDLRDIVADLDRAVSRSAGEEEFVTAALVEERGGTLTVLNCGHPGPLLLRQGRVIPLDPPRTAPPLGLSPKVEARVEHLEPGDRLLLYTDGLAEARRAGEFFPTASRAWALLGHGTVVHGLASLESALSEWVPRGEFEDDIALLLLEYTGAAPEAEPAVPSWQIGGAPAARA